MANTTISTDSARTMDVAVDRITSVDSAEGVMDTANTASKSKDALPGLQDDGSADEELSKPSILQHHERLFGVDVCKTMAMFMVVFLHYAMWSAFYPTGAIGTVFTVICASAVPLFFALNGALMLTRPLDPRRHWSRLLQLIIVITLWKILTVALFAFAGTPFPSVYRFVGFLLGSESFASYPPGYFWFLNALVAVYLVYPVLKIVFDSKAHGHATLKCLMGVLFVFTIGRSTLIMVLQGIDHYTGLGTASVMSGLTNLSLAGEYGNMALFFLLGGCMGRWHTIVQAWIREHGNMVLVYGGILAGWASLYGIQRLQNAEKGLDLTVDDGYSLLPTFIIVFFVLFLALGCKRSSNAVKTRLSTILGGCTFGVYLLHFLILTPTILWQKSVIDSGTYAPLTGFAGVAVNLVFALLVFLFCSALSFFLGKIPVIKILFDRKIPVVDTLLGVGAASNGQIDGLRAGEKN